MAETPIAIPPTVELIRPPGARVILVGAGGTGARVAGALIKLLRRPDSLVIVDHDRVEERNLERQHFVSRDIGQYKAEVVAARLQGEAARKGVTVSSIITPYTEGIFEECRWGAQGAPILLGCVDNRVARREMLKSLFYVNEGGVGGTERNSGAWLDVGNEMRIGQVALTLSHFPVKRVKRGSGDGAAWTGRDRYLSALTIPTLYPDMVTVGKGEAEQEACALRTDMQSVSANALAAAWAVTALTWILDELPISILGQTFSTLGGGAAIPMKGISGPTGGVYTALLT